MPAFTPHKDQIAPATPADVVPVAIPTETPATGTKFTLSDDYWNQRTWSVHIDRTRYTVREMLPHYTGIGEIVCRGIVFKEYADLISLAPEMAEALRDASIAAHSSSATREECQALIVRLNVADWDEARKVAAANARALLSKLKGSK